MFGRTLSSISIKNLNPVLKSIDRGAIVKNSSAIQSLAGVKYEQKSTQVNAASYSTQSKPIEVQTKKIEELKAPHKPTSPHVLIYRFPLPAVMSILHRVTGVALALGVTAICGAALTNDLPTYIGMIKANPFLLYPAKFCIALPLVYHFSTGVRHLIWDTSLKGINVPSADSTCKVILGVVAVASLFFTFFSFN